MTLRDDLHRLCVRAVTVVPCAPDHEALMRRIRETTPEERLRENDRVIYRLARLREKHPEGGILSDRMMDRLEQLRAEDIYAFVERWDTPTAEDKGGFLVSD